MDISSLLHSLGITSAEFFTELIGFIILIYLLKILLLKPITGILEERQNDIKTTYDQLDADRAAMEATRKEYEDRLAGIEQQAREKIQAAVKEAQDLRASIISDAQKQAEIVIANGNAEIERERTKAFTEMRRDVVDLAILAAGKVIGESMDEARQRSLVDQFIASVGHAPSSSANGMSSNGTGVA